ncbi:PRC-barrel domain-containing protein [Methylobacterium sp. A54F]
MHSLLAGMAALLLGTGAALAQAPDAPAPGQPATLSGDLRPTFVAQTPNDRVASKLVGLTIQNGANETIGEIADLVLDENSTVKCWIVGVGGFLGIGTKYVAIAPSAVKIARADNQALKATIDTTKDQLRAAPEYVYLGKEKPGEGKADANKADASRTSDAKPAETKPAEAPVGTADTGAPKP